MNKFKINIILIIFVLIFSIYAAEIKIFLKSSEYSSDSQNVGDKDTQYSQDETETSSDHLNKEKYINMKWIEPDCFIMGSPEGEGDFDEHPQHKVCLKGYYIDRYEVTQKEYEKITGKNPSVFSNCPECPVEYVSWQEAKEYCDRIGKRLPTEAEWEYAARAKSEKRYYWGNNIDTSYLWYSANSNSRTHPVGKKKPNAFGLYDMLGNVREWCLDKFSENTYRLSEINNPVATTGKYPVLRGGSWLDDENKVRCAARASEKSKTKDSNIGFRCVADK
jgi:formylglycine-generating enzyme required for sulfatase activity